MASANDGAKIAIYASGGHYRASNDVEALCDDVRRAIGQGHRRFKIKIGGVSLAADIKRIEAVFGLLERGMGLAVDGNGTFDLDKTIRYLDALKPYPLAWIEEPVHPLDFELHRDIAAQSPIALATGENLFSRDDARNLIRYAGLRKDRDILQFDISLSYGIVEYLRILDDLERARLGPRALRAACRASAGDERGRGPGARTGRGRDGHSTLFGKLTAGIPVNDGIATLPDAPGAGFEQISGLLRSLRRAVELKRHGTSHGTVAPSPLTSDDIRGLVRPDHVHRRAYADAAVFQLEQERIFGRLWIYVAHESQLKKPGDFVRTRLAAYEVLVTRHTDGNIYVLQNRCPHRGARICMVDRGNAKVFSCPYHAWSFRPDGSLDLGAASQELSGRLQPRRSAESHAARSAASRSTAASCLRR